MLGVVIFDRARKAWRRPRKATRWDWKKGDRCLALSPADRYYYSGVVQEECGPEYQVLLDDGREVCLTAEQLANPDLAPGTQVYAQWQGAGMYFSGKIQERDGERFFIHYDDGDKEWTVLSMIRVLF